MDRVFRKNSSTSHTYYPIPTLYEGCNRNSLMEENLQSILKRERTCSLPILCSSLIFFASLAATFFCSYFQSVEALMNTYKRELRLAQGFIFSTLVKRTQSCWALRWTLGWFCVKNAQIVIRKWKLSFLNVSLHKTKVKNKITKHPKKKKKKLWVNALN